MPNQRYFSMAKNRLLPILLAVMGPLSNASAAQIERSQCHTLFSVEKKQVPESELLEIAARISTTELSGSLKAVDKLVSILKEGKLDGGSKPRSESETAANYLMLETNSSREFNDPNQIEMHFEPSLLDRNDYFVNLGWSYGVYSHDSIRFDERAKLGIFLYHFGQGHVTGWDSHEVVFLQEIPIARVNRIEVPKKLLNQVLDRLTSEGVQPPPGKTWNQLIVPK